MHTENVHYIWHAALLPSNKTDSFGIYGDFPDWASLSSGSNTPHLLPTSHTTNHFIICKSMVTSLLKWYTVYGDRTWSRWSQGPDPQITHLQYFWSTTRQFPSPKFTEKNFLVSFGILKWPDHRSWYFFKMSFPFTNAVMFIMDALALANLLIYFGVII